MGENDKLIRENINAAKKAVRLIKRVNAIDNRYEKKIMCNARDIGFYNKLLSDANDNFYVIMKNLK